MKNRSPLTPLLANFAPGIRKCDLGSKAILFGSCESP
jgi:hypothetical protein